MQTSSTEALAGPTQLPVFTCSECKNGKPLWVYSSGIVSRIARLACYDCGQNFKVRLDQPAPALEKAYFVSNRYSETRKTAGRI